ncbi:MAG: hypothetical protein IJ418_19010 [Clostridia bacterium]|nr:hypothetical protein [Clostridia bacterium]
MPDAAAGLISQILVLHVLCQVAGGINQQEKRNPISCWHCMLHIGACQEKVTLKHLVIQVDSTPGFAPKKVQEWMLMRSR